MSISANGGEATRKLTRLGPACEAAVGRARARATCPKEFPALRPVLASLSAVALSKGAGHKCGREANRVFTPAPVVPGHITDMVHYVKEKEPKLCRSPLRLGPI